MGSRPSLQRGVEKTGIRGMQKPVMTRFARSVLLGLILIASLASAAATPFRIQMESWSPYFAPVAATVTAGSTIRWENPTSTHHTITHDGCRGTGACAFDSGSIGPDGVFEISGLAPGCIRTIARCILSCVGPWPSWMLLGDPLTFNDLHLLQNPRGLRAPAIRRETSGCEKNTLNPPLTPSRVSLFIIECSNRREME